MLTNLNNNDDMILTTYLSQAKIVGDVCFGELLQHFEFVLIFLIIILCKFGESLAKALFEDLVLRHLFSSSHLDEHPAVGAAEVQQVVSGSQMTLRLGRLIITIIIITIITMMIIRSNLVSICVRILSGVESLPVVHHQPAHRHRRPPKPEK